MRSAPCRITAHCPQCSGQLVIRVLLPKPEHRFAKGPNILSIECSTAQCTISANDVHRLLGL